jgi:hypothetical protein
LEDGVPVVFEVEDVLVGFVLGADVGEAFGCEQSFVGIALVEPF